MLSPHYIYSRIRQAIYIRTNPDMPWLTPGANDFLEKNLRKDMVMLEFGSGRSTLFFANLVGRILSRETNEQWFEKVRRDTQTLDNVDLRYFESREAYADVSNLDEASLDVVLIDGKVRHTCLRNSIPKLKAGGLLILDNAERYLEYPTRSPARWVRADRDALWHELEDTLEDQFWRVHTTDGKSDTLLFFKR